MSEFVNIVDQSSAAEARRRLRRIASAEALGEDMIERAAIVVTEAATNIVRHADHGHILIDVLDIFGRPRLVIAAMDKGPGIAKLDRMMEDGESTAGGPGNGLGAMQRLADRFDIHTAPDEGTVVACEFGEAGDDLASRRFDVAGLRVNHPGETVCGDALALRKATMTAQFFLCDGLGHGPRAAEAANAALESLSSHPGGTVETVLDDLSHALQPTRGAVAALCQVEGAAGQMSCGGIGNISMLHISNQKLRRLPSRDGRLGAPERQALVETIDITPGDLIILHSDGISTLRNLEQKAGLLRRSALTIAGIVIRDNLRGRDDASVAVIRVHAREERR